MITNLLDKLIAEEDRSAFREFIASVADSGIDIVLRNDIIQMYWQFRNKHDASEESQKSSSIFNFIKRAQELFLVDDHLALMHRYAIAKYRFYLIRKDGEYIEGITLTKYLDLRDACVQQTQTKGLQLRLDFMPFYDFTPTIRDIRSVGSGIRFLNRFMSSNIFSRPRKWLDISFNFI